MRAVLCSPDHSGNLRPDVPVVGTRQPTLARRKKSAQTGRTRYRSRRLRQVEGAAPNSRRNAFVKWL